MCLCINVILSVSGKIRTHLSIGLSVSIVDLPDQLWSSASRLLANLKILCDRIGIDGVLWRLIATFELGKHGGRRHHIGFD